MTKAGHMHYFSKGIAPDASSSQQELLGIEGNYLLELARLKLSVCPGIIIDSELCRKIHEGYDFKPTLTELIRKLEKSMGRQLGNPDNPLFLKAFQSTDIHYIKLLSIDHIGLCNKTAAGLARGTGETFAYSSYKDYLKQLGIKLYAVPESDFDDMAGSLAQSDKVEDIQTVLELYRDLLEDKLPTDHLEQLESIIQKTVSSFYSSRENLSANLSIIVQARVYGDYIDNSLSGWFYTRNNQSGEDHICGEFSQQSSDKASHTSKDIQSIDPTYLQPLIDIAKQIERQFTRIMKLHFVVERDVLWITSLNDCQTLSSKAKLKLLFDLHQEN
ncbi:MAG: hypothetical protein OEZ36_04230, partial [Spirochaetota bacterium]|nr:hypothetical protein [Spirochaetota bacterium]